MNGNARGQLGPEDRLVAVKREFGEWGGVNLSTENSVTYSVITADTLPAIFSGTLGPDNGGCYLYGRSLNPTVRVLGRMLAALEGTEAGYCCASGMAAISCTLLKLCNASDHIIASNTIYGGTYALLKDFLPKKCGITTTFVPINDHVAVAAAFQPNTKVVFCESISNPTLFVADIPSLADITHAAGATFVVDNTFAPMILSPALLGADIVIHSLTKFISGGSDAIAGAICGPKSFIWTLMDLHEGPLMLLGGVMDPKVASDLALRVPHLGVRMAEHSRRALLFAKKLQELGAEVCYPGLPSHPQHELLKSLSNPGYGFGGLLTVELDSLPAANAFMERLQNVHGFGLMAVSLGYFDTLMSASASSTSSELSGADLAKAGINPGLVRMSVGLTGSAELRVQQLEEAWCHVQAMQLTAQAAAAAAVAPGGVETGVDNHKPLLSGKNPSALGKKALVLSSVHHPSSGTSSQVSAETPKMFGETAATAGTAFDVAAQAGPVRDPDIDMKLGIPLPNHQHFKKHGYSGAGAVVGGGGPSGASRLGQAPQEEGVEGQGKEGRKEKAPKLDANVSAWSFNRRFM